MKKDRKVVEIKKNTYCSNTANLYDQKRTSSIYGKITDWLEKKVIDKLLHVINPKVILDLPCGTGRITEFLLKNNYDVIGTDVSSDMTKIAKNKLSRFKNLKKLIISSADKLNFKEDEFDCITSVRFMGHLPKAYRLKVLKEMKRVSKYLIISYHNRLSLMGIVKWFKIKLGLSDRNWFQVEKKQAIQELGEAGFRELKTIYILRGIAETYFILGKK